MVDIYYCSISRISFGGRG